MENKQYIKIHSYGIASIIADSRPYPAWASGLFRTIIYIRASGTRVIEGFYGQTYFFEEDSAEKRMDRLQQAIDKMMGTMKESDTFKTDNYEVRNHPTGRWERKKL